MHHRYYTSPIRPWQQERKPGSSRDESFKCNMRLFRNRKRWATNVVEIPIHSNLKKHVSFSLHFHCWLLEGAVSSMAMTTLNFTWLSWGGWLKVGEEASRWGSQRNFEKHETQDFNGTEKESKLQEKTGAWPQHQANNLAVDINQCWPSFTIELYDQFLSFLWTSLSFHRLECLLFLIMVLCTTTRGFQKHKELSWRVDFLEETTSHYSNEWTRWKVFTSIAPCFFSLYWHFFVHNQQII